NVDRLKDLKEKVYKKKKGMPWYGVNVTHRISIRIVEFMQGVEVEPDHITFFSIVLGIIAGLLFTIPEAGFYLAGALFVELYYVFDAVDGQYARLKKKTSTTGAYFDYISNHIVQSVVFAGMGTGLFRGTGEVLYLLSGFLASWGVLFMYIIHDAKASILRKKPLNTEDEGGELKEQDHSLPKRAFMFLHKTCTFPTTMNIITLCSLISVMINKGLILFRFGVVYYAIIINLVWIAKLIRIIKSKSLD
ncbi:MAG: hypothetical protein GF392_00960, partial [Candidatus Omnitrophica bacterium]|nr:hypothetical protein [Candidatus Omnitrophota bacterium]